MKRISRRRLAQLASAAAATPLLAQQSGAGEYTGPLTGVESNTGGRVLDPLPHALQLVDSAPRKLRFAAASKAEAVQWQGKLRTKLTELVGGFPAERVDLRPISLETR